MKPARTVDADGVIMYRIDGVLHRDDGPAKAWPDFNEEEWWVNGELHRIDGPAVVSDDPGVKWSVQGLRPPVDGRESEDYVDGRRLWWVRGRCIPPWETAALEELLHAGEFDILSHVLSAWKPLGPSPAELAVAVRAAL